MTTPNQVSRPWGRLQAGRVRLALTLAILSGFPALAQTESLPARRGWWIMSPLVEPGKEAARLAAALHSNPPLQGVLFNIGWDRVEKAPGQFDWSAVDRTVGVIDAANKDYALCCVGAAVPAFVYASGAGRFTYLDANPHHGSRFGTPQSMPLPWDPRWQDGYEALLRAVADRYAGDPHCASITLTVAKGGEMHFPQQPADMAKWGSYGDFRGKIVASYLHFMDVLAGFFPRQQIVLMVSQLFDGGEDPASPDHQAIAAIVDYGLRRYPGRFTLQNNQLDGRRDNLGKFSYDIVRRYGSLLHHGFQSVASFKYTPERQGSMDMAVLNYLQAGAEYWELWRGDGLDAETRAKLGALLEKARAMGPDAFKRDLIARGLFRSAADDHYSPTVDARR